jgi:hypothetical protein
VSRSRINSPSWMPSILLRKVKSYYDRSTYGTNRQSQPRPTAARGGESLRGLPMSACTLGVSEIRPRPTGRPVHEPGLVYVLAPLRNAVIAAELLMRKFWSILFVESNHTNPSSPYWRIPANRSVIFPG